MITARRGGPEELFKVAVNAGGPTKVAGSHRAFGHAEVGVDADYGIGIRSWSE